MKKTINGFTIVELLIVIVIIAILAAITIVAYTGIQVRSRNTATVNTVTGYVKALKLYEGDNGVFPEDGSSVNVYRCIGESYTSGCGTISGPTGCGLGNISNASSQTFNNQVRQYMTNAASVLRINENGLACSTGGVMVGAVYVYRGATNKKSELYYMLEGTNATCVVPGSTTLASQTTETPNTLCRLYLN